MKERKIFLGDRLVENVLWAEGELNT
jgi:hypothetical protein